MNNYIFNTIIIIVIALILIYVIYSKKKLEGFYGYPVNSSGPRYCGDCGKRDRFSCSNCIDCGYCYAPDGMGECVSGDKYGPHFRKDCVDYEYTYPYPTLYPVLGSIYPYVRSMPLGTKFTMDHRDRNHYGHK